MLEQLDYLIRTLTYKRSSLECALRNSMSNVATTYTEGEIYGLSIAITELYKMVRELTKDDNE